MKQIDSCVGIQVSCIYPYVSLCNKLILLVHLDPHLSTKCPEKTTLVTQSKYNNYALADLEHGVPECGQSHANLLLIGIVIYAGWKTAGVFMNECFLNNCWVS